MLVIVEVDYLCGSFYTDSDDRNEHAGILKHFCMEEIQAIVAHFSSQLSVLDVDQGPLYRKP